MIACVRKYSKEKKLTKVKTVYIVFANTL